jgi:hypothetical protein
LETLDSAVAGPSPQAAWRPDERAPTRTSKQSVIFRERRFEAGKADMVSPHERGAFLVTRSVVEVSGRARKPAPDGVLREEIRWKRGCL